MADDTKTEDTVLTKAVETYLDIEDQFRAEKLKLNGEINKRKEEALAKVFSRVAKLDVMKEGFLFAVDQHRDRRRQMSTFDKIEAKDDLDLAGGYARTILATGAMFEPLYDAKMKEHLEAIVDEVMTEPSSENVTQIRGSEAA